MTRDPYGQWMGTPMDDRDIDDTLVSAGWGVLSLAADDEPYSIPVSFGYDGEAVYFVFIRDSSTSTKFEFVEEGKTARLLATDVRGRFDWASVSVTGPVRAVEKASDEWEHMIATLDDNGWFSTDFERAGGFEDLQGWRLEPDEVRGIAVRGDED